METRFSSLKTIGDLWRKLSSSDLKSKARSLLEIIEECPNQNPLSYEKLVGDLEGAYSQRIDIQYRLVYQVIEEEDAIEILGMWTHYE